MGDNIRIVSGRKVIKFNDGVIREVRPFTTTHLIKEHCYYMPDNPGDIPGEKYAYVYRGTIKKNQIPVPGSIYKKGKKYIWTEHLPEVKEAYNLSRCQSLNDVLNVRSKLLDPNLKFAELNPELVDGVAGDIFAPRILDSDGTRKRIIKTALQHMQINPATLREKFENDYDLNNMKSQLQKEGSMSEKYFNRWIEVLDLQIETIVRSRHPNGRLKDEITIITN